MLVLCGFLLFLSSPRLRSIVFIVGMIPLPNVRPILALRFFSIILLIPEATRFFWNQQIIENTQGLIRANVWESNKGLRLSVHPSLTQGRLLVHTVPDIYKYIEVR